jgi:hypothetical protein
MKNLSLILLILFIVACGYQQEKQPNNLKDSTQRTDHRLSNNTVDCDTTSWYKTKKDRDSVLVFNDEGEKSFYTNGELNRILKSYPELNDTTLYNSPNEAYEKRGTNAVLKPCDNHLWGCEVCKDQYYVLYAYFLKQRNGDKKFKQERLHLIELYRDVNHIFDLLAQGGTYFGHQYYRIIGYAEYAIFLKRNDTNHDIYRKKYDISKQKSFYINGLKQLIEDEISHNYDISEKDKLTLKKQLFETVSNIDRLITSYFYLTMTQEFHYSNY